MFCSGTEEEAVALDSWLGWMTGTAVSFISEDLQNGSIYPVKKSFGTFVLQELALHKAARRIMKKETKWILVLLLWNFNLNTQKLKD